MKRSEITTYFTYAGFTVVLFLLLYNPYFVFLSSGFTRYIIVFILLLNAPFLPTQFIAAIKNKYILSVLLYLLLLIVVNQAIAVFHQTYDFNVSNCFTSVLFISVPVTFLITHYLVSRRNADFDTVLFLISMAVSIQSFFILAEWFVPTIRSVLSSLIMKRMETLVRSSGISSLEGDGLSFIQATGAMITFYLSLFTRYGARYKPVLFAMLFFQLLSLVFTARTGLVLFVLFAMMTILFNRNRMRHIKRIVVILLLSILIGFGLYTLIIPSESREMLETTLLPWAFEFGYRYIERGSFETSSTTELFTNMLFLPDSDATLFWGDGLYLDPLNPTVNYVNSDSGYIRTIFFSGLFGSFILYFYFIILLLLFKKFSLDSKRFIFCSTFLLVLFISQIKLPFLYYVTTYHLLFLFMFSLFFEYKKNSGHNHTGPNALRTTIMPNT